MRMTVAPFVLLASVLSTAALAEEKPPAAVAPAAADAKAADIRRLLTVTGAARMGDQMIDRILELQKRTRPEVPAEMWTELRSAMDTSELVELIAGVWDRNFTHEDIVGLIAFYESPLGLRLIEAQPKIFQESMTLGEQWGLRSAEKMMEKLRQKGFPNQST